MVVFGFINFFKYYSFFQFISETFGFRLRLILPLNGCVILHTKSLFKVDGYLEKKDSCKDLVIRSTTRIKHNYSKKSASV